MELKTKVIIGSVALATAFAAGRFTVPEKTKIVTQTVEVEKKNQDIKQKVNKTTKTVIVKNKDGSETITKTTNLNQNTDDQSKTTIDQSTDKSSETVRGDSKVTISALAGYDFKSGGLAYGASVSKPVIGPITIGIFGLTNETFGCSVGLTF